MFKFRDELTSELFIQVFEETNPEMIALTIKALQMNSIDPVIEFKEG